MAHSSIIDLIRTSEMLNDKATLHYLNSFNRNIGVSQIIVLSQLQEHGPQMPSHLAKKLGYTSGAMTGIANKLIEAGYTKRQSQESDRRMILLEITSEGREILKESHDHGVKMREELYSALTNQEIEQYLNIQKKLLKYLMEND